MLFYWQREVVQSIKCRGANNFSSFQCEIRLIHQMVIFYNPSYSSLPGLPIIVEGAVSMQFYKASWQRFILPPVNYLATYCDYYVTTLISEISTMKSACMIKLI